MKLVNFFKVLKKDERGVSALEYAILAAVIVGAVAAAGTVFRSTITDSFDKLGEKIEEQIEDVGD